MKLGTLDIDDFKLGSSQVNKIMLGSTQIWAPPAAGITLRGTSEASDTSTSTGSLTLPIPTGLQVGDYATITLAVHASGTTNVTWPSDFTQFVSNTNGTNSLLSAEGEITAIPGGNEWTISVSRNQRMAAQCLAYSGGLAADAIKNDTIDEADGGSGNPIQFPSYNTDSDDSWLVQYMSISGSGVDQGFGAVAPASMTEHPVADASIPAGWGIILQGAYENIPTAGATGTRDWTNPDSNGWSVNTWVMRAA